MPAPKWKIDGFDKIEFKVKKGIKERFKAFLIAKYGKGRTMQEYLETYINNLLS